MSLLGVVASARIVKTEAALRARKMCRWALENAADVQLEYPETPRLSSHRGSDGRIEAYLWFRLPDRENEWMLLNKELVTHGFAEPSTLTHPRRKEFIEAHDVVVQAARERGVGRFDEEGEVENWPYDDGQPSRPVDDYRWARYFSKP